jgi:hypothetical protein
VTRKDARGSDNGDTARNAAVTWDRHRERPDGRAEHPLLSHRLPRRMRPQRRQAAHRPGPGTVPDLERQARGPPGLGTATARRIYPPE